jgi:multiple sugar transport system ATP-binding protein
MSAVSVSNLSKTFGNLKAVQNFSFDCKDGELLFILGPSGAGKTTTLMLIAGLLDPDAGSILIAGRPITDLQPWERNVSMAFESYALYPHYSVFDNLAFPLRSPRHSPRLSTEEIAKKVKDIANMLQIGELLHRKPGQLSGGQRQRVSLGRVLVRNAAVYLLDEPLLHLDAKLRYEMMGELKNLQDTLNVTMIMVGPDFVEALSIANRIVVVNTGMIVQQVGVPNEIFEKPSNLFVADLIGEPRINLFDCDLARESGALYLTAQDLKVEVPERNKEALKRIKEGERVVLGIRAADIKFVETETSGYSAQGVIDITEPLGWSTLVECSIGGRILNLLSDDPKQSPGKKVRLQFDPTKLHFFEKNSGIAIY